MFSEIPALSIILKISQMSGGTQIAAMHPCDICLRPAMESKPVPHLKQFGHLADESRASRNQQ